MSVFARKNVCSLECGASAIGVADRVEHEIVFGKRRSRIARVYEQFRNRVVMIVENVAQIDVAAGGGKKQKNVCDGLAFAAKR